MSSPDPDRWSILYRGPLASCNYACPYCPFAKTRDSRAALAEDARCLERFVDWVEGRRERIGVLFTPWGEALGHRHYQAAMTRLSWMPQVWRVSAQTNLSAPLAWLDRASRETLALWTTFHPGETTMERFLRQCDALRRAGFRFSVGVVGRREAIPEIVRLRAALPPEVYVWVNAWKREANYYTTDEVELIRGIDPLFAHNLQPQPTRGGACRAGATAFTVDGRGEVRRCHFVSGVLGNLYEREITSFLRPRPCPAESCRCHIGYVHYEPLRLYDVFGDGLLERIPHDWGSTSALASTRAR